MTQHRAGHIFNVVLLLFCIKLKQLNLILLLNKALFLGVVVAENAVDFLAVDLLLRGMLLLLCFLCFFLFLVWLVIARLELLFLLAF